MTQDWLKRLTIPSIERDILERLEYKHLIKTLPLKSFKKCLSN